LLYPLNLILFSAWFCPSLRLGLLALTRLWMHLLLFRLKLWLLNFWWCSIFGYTPLMSHCVALRRLWLLLWMLAAYMSTWSYSWIALWALPSFQLFLFLICSTMTLPHRWGVIANFA
jgi:hypothetical protein